MPEGLMNEKLLRRLSFFSFAFLTSTSLVLAEEHKHLCPDMSEHEQVLNEGIKMHKQFEVPRRSSSMGWGLYALPESPRQFRYVDDSTPSQREQAAREYWSTREKTINLLSLSTLSEKQSGEKLAEEFEERGMYSAAQKLYKRLLEAQQWSIKAEQEILPNTVKNLDRAKLCQSGIEAITAKQYSVAIDSLDKAVENIRTTSFDTFTKSELLTQLMNNFKAILSKDANPSLSSGEELKAQKVKTDAEEQLLTWKREMECLGMAQKLDRTAWKLELAGQYAMAEKLYRQALLIKHKNLGAESLETLAQNGDLARVCVALGRKREACRYYEDALKALRNHPNPGRTYVTMLENYGDMLDRMHEKSRAERIYEEARISNNKTGSSNN